MNETILLINIFIFWKIWMYFATLLKTTAPVKLPISQLSLFVRIEYK
jgi:hypothetical protein